RARERTERGTQSIARSRSEEHTSELQSRGHLVCRLLLEKKNKGGGPKHGKSSKTSLRHVVYVRVASSGFLASTTTVALPFRRRSGAKTAMVAAVGRPWPE